MEETFEQNQEVEASPLNEEAILFDPTSTNFFMLNSTSTFIWEQLSTPVTIERIATALAENFANVTPEKAIVDARDTVEKFVSMDLAIATGDA